MNTNSEPSWAAPEAPAAYPPASGASPDAARSKGRRSRAHREPGYGQAPKAASGSSYPGTGPLPSSSELRREAQRTAEISARTTSPEEDVEHAGDAGSVVFLYPIALLFIYFREFSCLLPQVI